MDSMSSLVSVSGVAVALVVYLASLAFYRLFLHPLSRFPGPKLAAVTRYYEGYYDVYLNGQYTFKIAELHKEYGPIIRISPYELHVSDPSFFDVLYRQDKAYDKYAWATDAFGLPGGTVVTPEHTVHRARRRPMAPFFSHARVASQIGVVHGHVSKLCERIRRLAETGATFNLGAATLALTRDVAYDFILDKSYNSLDLDDFDIVQLRFAQGAGGIWRLSKFVRFIGPLLQSLPIPLVTAIADNDTKEFFRHFGTIQDDTKKLMAQATSTADDDERPRNLVDEIMHANLPHTDKKFTRVFQDIAATTSAGFETTAAVLRMMIFHVYSNKGILARLRSELDAAGASAENQLDLKALEQLPYLGAVLHEGLRMSPANATRMARISPHEDIPFNDWLIPANTPVGMTVVLMHQDESIWPEPKRFNPERWLKDGKLVRIDKGFAPFSKGTRMCAGSNLAWAEMYTTIADLVQRFDFQFQDAKAEDFECTSDQFAIGTNGKGNLMATAALRQK